MQFTNGANLSYFPRQIYMYVCHLIPWKLYEKSLFRKAKIEIEEVDNFKQLGEPTKFLIFNQCLDQCVVDIPEALLNCHISMIMSALGQIGTCTDLFLGTTTQKAS